MVLLTVTLLGGFDARLASGASLRLPKKAQALLAYLGVRPGCSQSRDKLAALLWGDKSDPQARDGLRHALAALRRGLGETFPHLLHLEGRALALNPDRVEVDVATFERLLAEKTVPDLEQSASLYRGDLLLGFTVSEPLFECCEGVGVGDVGGVVEGEVDHRRGGAEGPVGVDQIEDADGLQYVLVGIGEAIGVPDA